ncbi:MAG: dihydrolipoyl dehydrogenase [Spirochaetia bacterium]
MAEYDYDLVIIGSGPGGYVAAIRASQLGLKTAVIEKDKPGGVCLNIGCIPTKALIHQAEVFSSISGLKALGVKSDTSGFDYKKVFKKSRTASQRLSRGVQSLLKKNNVEYIEGYGKLKDGHTVEIDGEEKVTGKNIILATGSRPKEIPVFPFDGEKVVSSDHALMFEELPESMIILGAGSIGTEFAYILSTFGVKLTIVEMLDSILPLEDRDAAEVVAKAFKKAKITIYTSTKAEKVDASGEGVSLSITKEDGSKEELEADKLLVSVGRAPNLDNLGLEDAGIETENGFIKIGDYYQTSIESVYAIGDIVPSPMLAHAASKEGEIVVEHLAGVNTVKRQDPNSIPNAVYSEPQVGSFGLTEKEAKDQGVEYEAASFPYRGAGKSVTMEAPEGLVKVIYDPKTKEILGGHVAGVDATEIVHELLLAKKSELLPEDIATMVHAHPTLSEAVMESARSVEGWAIHV